MEALDVKPSQKARQEMQSPLKKAPVLVLHLALFTTTIGAIILFIPYPNDLTLDVFARMASSEGDSRAPSCAEILYSEALSTPPDAGEILTSRNRSRKAYFLFETSHTGMVSGRQACVVESAAKNNADADVYLVFVQPPGVISLKTNEQLTAVARRYRNVQVVQVMSLNATENEILQFASENGGTLLDWDVVITRDLGRLGRNFVCLNATGSISDRLFRLSKSHPLIKSARGNLERRLKDYCQFRLINKRRAKRCGDVSIYPTQFFYPINAEGERDAKEIFFGVNVFQTERRIIRVGSNNAISEVAQSHCPRAYWTAYDSF